MPPPLLQLTDIRFTLGGKPLLEGVDLQVAEETASASSAATAPASRP